MILNTHPLLASTGGGDGVPIQGKTVAEMWVVPCAACWQPSY